MKLNIDRNYFKYSFYAFLSVAMSIIFYLLLKNLGFYLVNVRSLLVITRRILSPFIIGASIAYLLNPGASWFEKKIYGKSDFIVKHHKLHRFLSVLTIYIIIVSSISMLGIYVAPQISNNIRDIINRMPDYISSTNDFIRNFTEEIETISQVEIAQHIDSKINRILYNLTDSLESLLDNAIISLLTITSGVINFVLGLILSFYMLIDKEAFKKGSERILMTFLSNHNIERIKAFGREANELFSRFIVGKSIDSFIIGCMCFIGLRLMGIRYALLLSVIVGITNMIPYFGPFIGAVPATFITFFDSPLKAFWLLLFILALQQFDGLILGPKILGDSVGVSPFWIIFSIVVGGKLFGVIGMFLGVPVIAIIRLIIVRAIDRQIERRNNRNNKAESSIL